MYWHLHNQIFKIEFTIEGKCVERYNSLSVLGMKNMSIVLSKNCPNCLKNETCLLEIYKLKPLTNEIP